MTDNGKVLIAIAGMVAVAAVAWHSATKKCGASKVTGISENTANASGRPAVPTTPENMNPAQLSSYLLEKSFPGGSNDPL